jgi:hypothetical protein
VEVHVDVIPDREVLREPFVKGSVSLFYATQSFVREDDTESECVVGGVPLPELDPVVRIEKLDKGRKVETRRPTSDDRDVQCRTRGCQVPFLSRNRWSLPVAVRGSASANSISRGYL